MRAKNISLAEKRRLAHETDLQRMAGLLMQHRHDQAGFTRYGNFAVFHQFLQEETRLPQIMTEVLDIEPRTSRVPVVKVVSLGCTRILLGKEYIANVAEILQDPHVARQLDLAAEEAIHPDTYANPSGLSPLGRSLLAHANCTAQARLEIIKTYHQRIQIDNAVIKMLKTCLTLENWPSHSLEAVANHVLMVCLMFNVIGLFKSQRGRSYTGKSIAKLRSEFLGVLAIAIYAGSEYAILTLEEFVEVVARSVGIQLDAGTFT